MISETLTYIAVATGIIGALTSIAAIVISLMSFHRVKSIKELDLRIELKREVNETHVAMENFTRIKEDAVRSRRAVGALAGQHGSSVMQQWQNQCEEDEKHIEELAAKIPETNLEYGQWSTKELEAKLGEVHRVKLSINNLTQKYEDAMASDQSTRNQINQNRKMLP